MRKTIQQGLALVIASASLAACSPQSTPSMMNNSQVQLSRETIVEQVPVKDINDAVLTALAGQYNTHGTGPIDLTMTYDPKSSSYTAMKAVNQLKDIKKSLAAKGIKNVITQTMAVPEGMPSLMVSFNTMTARAPLDCGEMPGLYNNDTSRFIGDYKFGCATETLFAKQIARPSDLEGNTEMGVRSARRDTVVIEGYSAGEPSQPLDGIERDDLASGN